MSLFLNPKVITLAMLASLAPFAIDTYLPAFHIIAQDLFTTPELIQQSLTFYLAPYTIMTLFHGAISDSIGRIKSMQWGLTLFFFASIGCALSTSVEMLWFFRVLQGIGGGAGNVVARAMVRDLYEGAEAQRVMATIQIIFGIAPAIAPMIGGLLLEIHWQIIFIFLAFYAGLSWFMAKKILPETLKHSELLSFSANADFIFLILAVSANFSAFFIYVLSSPIFLIDHLGFNSQQFGYLFIPTVSGMILGSYLSKRAAGIIPAHRLLRYGYFWMLFMTSFNLIFCASFDNYAPINIAFIALYNIGMASIMPVISLAALDCFPKMRGTAASGQAFSQMLFSTLVAGIAVPFLWFSTLGLAIGFFGIFCLGFIFIIQTQAWKKI
jgi:DHA1 family bicyclomycin/chloramphenicol resistance-like MFS transporter